MYLNKYERRKWESFTGIGIGWNVECWCCGVTTWLFWHSELLISYFQTLKVVKYDCKTHFLNIYTKSVLHPQNSEDKA